MVDNFAPTSTDTIIKKHSSAHVFKHKYCIVSVSNFDHQIVIFL